MQDPAFIKEMIAKAELAVQKVKEEFEALDLQQLNWKPDEHTWSIGQCLDHIITADTLYFPELKQIADGTYRMSFWQKYNPMSGLFGRMLVSQIQEVPRKKYVAPKVFTPQSGSVDAVVRERFYKHIDTLMEYMASFRRADADKVHITSPAARMVTYSLRNGLKLILQHAHRHINQGIRVKQHKDFPV